MPIITGHIDTVSRTALAGWIANQSAPHEAVQIRIVVDGTVVGHLRADTYRSDLVRAFDGATGRYSFRFQFSPPLSVFEPHEVSVVFENNLLTSRRWTRSIPSIINDTLPILVTSAGRSGSTFIMNQLNAHPEIVLASAHPAEVKNLAYYALVMRTLTSAADRERSTDPDTMLDNRYTIGFNPFHEETAEPLMDRYWNRTVPLTLSRTFRELILAYYETVMLLDQKSGMRYFAEKAQPDPIIRQCAILMFGGVREIVLLRDPRDLVCSYHSFWNTEINEARRVVASQLAPLLTLWEQKTPSTLFLKYEDLTRGTLASMRQVYEFLGVESIDEVMADTEVFKRHGTSSSPEASIGRWKVDLPADVIAACEVEFAPFLSAFAYEAR